MKKMAILPVLALLLCGCMAGEQEADTSSTQKTGLYVEDSVLEQLTGGVVKQFDMPWEGSFDIISMGQELLLLDKGSTAQLAVLTGSTLEVAHRYEPDGQILSGKRVWIEKDRIAYWDESDGSVVFLNEAFRQTGRLKLPQDAQSAGYLSPDWKTVYYCTETHVLALDLTTGVARLVKEYSGSQMQIEGVFQYGEVLLCTAKDGGGKTRNCLINSRTGEILAEGAFLTAFADTKDGWVMAADRGSIREILIGAEKIKALWPQENDGQLFVLLEENALICAVRLEDGCRLDHYDLNSGMRLYSIVLPGQGAVRSFCSDGSGLFFIAADAQGKEMICRWERSSSLTGDAGCYLEDYHTREDPDAQGLAALQDTIGMLEAKFGVDILVAEEVKNVLPAGYNVQTEYLIQAYEMHLPALEKALSNIPAGIWKQTTRIMGKEKLHIVLVRSIAGVPGYGGQPETACLQYWHNQEAYLMIALGEETQESVYHALFQAMQTRILSVSAVYYEWERLNPEGFVYDNDYIKNLQRQEENYLQKENRAFIDVFSMSFATEDRARMFAYACMPGKETYFEAPIMRKKLAMLCQGIREVFSWDAGQETPIWEQYIQHIE